MKRDPLGVHALDNEMSEGDFLSQHSSDLEIIRAVSDEAFDLYRRLLPQKAPSDRKEYWNLATRFVAVARSTSDAISTLLAQGHHLPALALTRIRFEQTVVLSYLFHEQPAVGFKPYSRFAPITEYQVAEAVIADPVLSKTVPKQLDVEALKGKALDAQLEINPGFDMENGRFQSKWTKLDLYSMALRRDKLAETSGWFVSRHLPLANLYTALYKTASSPVHADGSMLVPPLWGILTASDGKTTADASVFWALALPAYVTHYDLIICYEVLRWAGVDAHKQFVDLAQKLVS